MTWDWGNTFIVALLLAGWWFIEWAGRRDLFAKALQWARIRLSRRVPAGYYRVETGASIGFGHPDTVLILRLPLTTPEESRPAKYTGAADASTRFSVGDVTVTLDEFLEAYDEELGSLHVQVYELGKIAEIGIDTEDGIRPNGAGSV